MKSIANAVGAGLIVTGLAAAPIVAGAAEKGHKEDGHKHEAQAHKGHHGGVVSQVGHQEFELLAKPGALTLYVSTDEKPVSTKGGSASLTLLSGTDKATVKLEPAGDNRFEAKGNFKVSAGTKVLAAVNLPGKKAQQVRFTVK